MPESTPTPTPVVACPICMQDVPCRLAPSGVLRIARHQTSGSTPTQGHSCSGIGWEVTEK